MTSSRQSERRQLTVMFCDIVDSTALSLRLDPEDLADVIAMYRRESAKLIERHGGMVARYDGDAILAYFGYPRAHENDAERAVRAALAIVNAQWPIQPAGALRVHAGIATGLVVVGRLLESGDYLAAIGSTTNLAARLQGSAAAGAVVVSDGTRRLTGGLFEYRDLGPQHMKGFDEPVQSWQAIGERTVGSRFHALHQSARTPLFDRQAEIAQLRELWRSVKAGGGGRALLISAEAGIGKSRLTEVVAEEIVGRDVLRVWYHCLPNMQGSPLAPVIRQFAVAAGFGERDDDETKRGKLARLVPTEAPDAMEIAETLTGLLSLTKASASAPAAMSPQRQKQKLFATLMRSLEAFAIRGPLLLVVEDLHWIDPSSDELMGMLLERLHDLPILALFTARPEFAPHWADTSRLGHMSLAPLGRTDSIAMIEALCGERPIGDDAVRQIVERTDGVPLFIEDLTRDVVEAAGLRDAARQSGAVAVSVPATLHDSLMSRLDRLGGAKRVAETGAVIGREFSYELLAKVADMPEDDLRDELRRLVDAGLIVVQPSTVMLGYAFKHALVRDAAYAGLLNKTRASLHARIARTLIDEFPDTAQSQPDAIAHHLQAANDADGAADYLVKAAKLSARRSGFVEAIRQLERALALLAAQPHDESRLRREVNVYRTMGGIYAEYRGFASADCGRAYEAALERCRALGDAPEIFAVLSGVGSYAITRADFATCRALAEECLERAARQASKPPFVMGKLLLGGTLFLQGELPDARVQLDEALRLYQEIGGQRRGGQVLYVQDQKSTALCYLALVQTITGDPHAGIAAAEQGLAHSRSLGGPHAVNFSLCYLAAALHIAGDADAALMGAEQSIDEARERGFATWVGISRVVRGASLIRRGMLDEGIAELARGTEAHALTGAVAYQTFAHALHAEGLAAAGRLAEARSAIEKAISISDANGERFYAAELWRVRGDILASAGDDNGAAQAFRDAMAIARRQHAALFERRSAERLARLHG
jgi:class 3 adenylate cyclase/tetratricopeptide (TPR) repeat protein